MIEETESEGAMVVSPSGDRAQWPGLKRHGDRQWQMVSLSEGSDAVLNSLSAHRLWDWSWSWRPTSKWCLAVVLPGSQVKQDAQIAYLHFPFLNSTLKINIHYCVHAVWREGWCQDAHMKLRGQLCGGWFSPSTLCKFRLATQRQEAPWPAEPPLSYPHFLVFSVKTKRFFHWCVSWTLGE